MRPNQHELPLVEKRDRGYICQYTTMTDIGRKLYRIEILYQGLLRVFPAVKRRVRRWWPKLPIKSAVRLNMEVKTNINTKDSSGNKLEIGDMVTVLPYSQIKSTLNDKGYFKGLSFLENMEKCCGNSYKVLKIPQYVLDQGGSKINKCKNVVILAGLYCNGKGTVLEEGCDRSCLHYWKSDWLRKVG
jgi:hypothetical protein